MSPPQPEAGTITASGDDPGGDDVQFVSEIIHVRPKKWRRKKLADSARPDDAESAVANKQFPTTAKSKKTPERRARTNAQGILMRSLELTSAERTTSGGLTTPDATPKKETRTTLIPASTPCPALNPGPTTPTKRKRRADPITPSTPAILVSRTPSPPTAAPAARPPRPPPLYSIPPYIPPPPPPPPKKPRRPWNSKLFASLAQALQQSFSFEDFAAEHGRPVTEVLDVFSACVQLPLLAKSAEGLTKGGKKARKAVIEFQELMGEVRAAHDVRGVVVRETQNTG
ncbi:MAG: hypothetical protein M1839_006668 [Geoglossum umbratile]|nr:MAG: hypothetical protein M1839_006668 [Geoglossum umbratile]